jgi:hypothetical protein
VRTTDHDDGGRCAGATTTTTLGATTTTTVTRGATTTIPPGAAITSAEGSPFGYSVPDLTIFGGVPPCAPVAPTPSVTLAPDASNSPQTADAPPASARSGPATLFSSGALAVHTEASLGVGGYVSSSADVQKVDASGVELFSASSVRSTCTASASGVTGSTAVNGGVVQTSQGDPDVGGDETNVAVPPNPAPNTFLPGRLETIGDSFRYIFNEQVANPDGSLTVYAVHLELLGPTAVGDVYIGAVTCDVGATGTTSSSTTTTSVDDHDDDRSVLARLLDTPGTGGIPGPDPVPRRPGSPTRASPACLRLCYLSPSGRGRDQKCEDEDYDPPRRHCPCGMVRSNEMGVET